MSSHTTTDVCGYLAGQMTHIDTHVTQTIYVNIVLCVFLSAQRGFAMAGIWRMPSWQIE
jgi:hypothetical protein